MLSRAHVTVNTQTELIDPRESGSADCSSSEPGNQVQTDGDPTSRSFQPWSSRLWSATCSTGSSETTWRTWTSPSSRSGSGEEQQMLKLPNRDGQESVRNVQLRDTNTAQKLQAAISDAQVAQQQHRMARQKLQRFLKANKKQ